MSEPTHAFILRIWVEKREDSTAKLKWRGVMEHVESEERFYFDRVDEVEKYLSSYLEGIGVSQSNN
jgi:hypothetical protein